jgi:hypothetical protein
MKKQTHRHVRRDRAVAVQVDGTRVLGKDVALCIDNLFSNHVLHRVRTPPKLHFKRDAKFDM